MSKVYSLGIDVGSTTVKTVILDDNSEIIRSRYQRHFSKVREKTLEMLKGDGAEKLELRGGLRHLIGKAFDENWGLPDPTGQSDEVFLRVIAQIEEKIRGLTP